MLAACPCVEGFPGWGRRAAGALNYCSGGNHRRAHTNAQLGQPTVRLARVEIAVAENVVGHFAVAAENRDDSEATIGARKSVRVHQQA